MSRFKKQKYFSAKSKYYRIFKVIQYLFPDTTEIVSIYFYLVKFTFYYIKALSIYKIRDGHSPNTNNKVIQIAVMFTTDLKI